MTQMPRAPQGPRVRVYPALDVSGGESDLVLAALDDFSPIAIEEREPVVRAFFSSADARDAARDALAGTYTVATLDVADEDWARRSQANLQPVTVGRITIVANRELSIENPESETLKPLPAAPKPIAIVIPPSMGFGTGHHATTRLCLDALQRIDLAGKRVLDVGTGSGVLAIAANLLGAAEATGIDVDEDAIRSARENLALNPDATGVRFERADLAQGANVTNRPDYSQTGSSQTSSSLTGSLQISAADVVLANLTGALLVRAASTLRGAVASNGVLILSGLQSHERDDLVRAFEPAIILWQREEESWVGLAMRKS